MEESDQAWLYGNTRPFEFLVRRMVQNQLQVNRIPLNGTVLKYEFLDLKKNLVNIKEVDNVWFSNALSVSA